MSKTLTGMALVALLAAALSGCIDGGDIKADVSGATTTPPKTAAKVQVSDNVGSIKGALLSGNSLSPVAGAVVTIIANNVDQDTLDVVTAQTGEYVVNGLLPGSYTVFVTHIEFYANQKLAVVRAGQVTETSMLLNPLPSDKPYMEYNEISGYLPASVIWHVEVPTQGCIVDNTVTTVKSCGGYALDPPGGSSFLNQNIWINVTEDVKTLVVELVWDPAGPLGKYLNLDFMCPEVPRSGGNTGAVLDTNHPCYYAGDTFESPIMIRVDSSDWENGQYNATGDWNARVFAAWGTLGTYPYTGIDIGLAYEQPFTYYTSVFHKQPAAADYIGRPEV